MLSAIGSTIKFAAVGGALIDGPQLWMQTQLLARVPWNSMELY